MQHSSHKAGLFALALGSVGVVYGDIGTSPLYAFRESLAAVAHHGGAIDTAAVLGVLSLILWSLILIVTIKYVATVLRADNQGEGGVLSLMSLARGNHARFRTFILILGITGASLFYGDAVITPAISVLSAVEGLKLVTATLTPFVVLIATVIIVLLFLVQRCGTARVAKFFGPIMAVWFVAMAAGGIVHIADSPEVWKAFNPAYGVHFLLHHGYASFIALGAVVLSITGAEALYADMGHFGKKPIRLAWLWFVMPALMLNYIGQAAMVLAHPEAAENAFFLLYPDWALLPMVILATLATIIASQAVITGAYSLTYQAIQLGLLPRLHVKFTSAERMGQIYMPQVNLLLMVGVVLLIEIFHTSSNLASAYGIAVTGTMVMTAILLFFVMRRVWNWSRIAALLAVAPLLIIDLAFFTSNLTKVFQGGFVPLMLSAALMMVVYVWRRGSHTLQEQVYHHNTTMPALLKKMESAPPKRVSGIAVYLTSSTQYAPSALLQNLTHNKVLHEYNILLTLQFEQVPYIDDAERMKLELVNADIIRVTQRCGFMESPDVTRGIRLLARNNITVNLKTASFFISRRNIVPSAKFGMPIWQDRIYIWLANNATDAADYFHIPLDRVVELGVQMTV